MIFRCNFYVQQGKGIIFEFGTHALLRNCLMAAQINNICLIKMIVTFVVVLYTF
jgi:uncharacterized membrane protein YesL